MYCLAKSDSPRQLLVHLTAKQQESPRRIQKSPAIYSPQDCPSKAITSLKIKYCPQDCQSLAITVQYLLKEQALSGKSWKSPTITVWADLLADSRLAQCA